MNGTRFKAETAGYRAGEILERDERAVVEGVFEHAVYLKGEGDTLVKLITEKDYIGPASIAVFSEAHTDFKSSGLVAGAEITASGQELRAAGNGFAVDLSDAGVWNAPPDPEERLGLEEMNLNMRVLRDVIYTHPSREGLVPLLESVELKGPMEVFLKEQRPSVAERARPYIERLMWAFFSGDLNGATENAGRILGLGPGLTPSCDDFLAGLIFGLKRGIGLLFNENDRALPGFIDKFATEIIKRAKDKTTVYSVSYLDEAARGEAPAPAWELVYAVVSKNPDEAAALSRKLVGMGETSGSDTAVGIYYGMRFLISRIEMEELNETA